MDAHVPRAMISGPTLARAPIARLAVAGVVVLLGWRGAAGGTPSGHVAPAHEDPRAASVADLRRGWEQPPASAAPLMRWWWFGPALDPTELAREMRAMKAAGIGGFEIQPVYPLALDDEASAIRTLPFLSDEFVGTLRFVNDTARELGLRVDITLGSGWPFGGPGVPIGNASAKLRVDRLELPPGVEAVPLPHIAAGERLLAVFLERSDPGHAMEPKARVRLPLPTGDRIEVSPRPDGAQLVFFVASRTGMQVKRAAVGAEGFVLDHYDRRAVEGYLRAVGDRLLSAFGDRPPHAIFCDSLEAYEGDWTGDLLAEFQRRRGYDLSDHLPALVVDDAPDSADVRHDWGRTLSELVNERFFAPLASWARRAETRVRAQAYGIPPATLSSNALIDLVEGEGTDWTRLTAARWASSAAHVYDRVVASSETWTWLHSPAFRASPLDLKAEADRHFLQGINQLIGHGWPYSPPSAEYPGWQFYAAGAFNDSNPWWIVMPDVARYLQRVSFVLRQGEPAADVAVYLPTSDAWARFSPGRVNLFETLRERLGGELFGAIARAGLTFDVVDDEVLARHGTIDAGRLMIGRVAYRALVLPNVERMSPATLALLEAFARRGGLVLATRRIPSRAPGLLASPAEQVAFRERAARLFQQPGGPGRVVAGEGDILEHTLVAGIGPRVRLTPAAPALGFVHRRMPDADVFFLANTSNLEVNTSLELATVYRFAEIWDPLTGAVTPSPVEHADRGRLQVPLALAPYGSRIVVTSDRRPPAARRRARPLPAPVTIAAGWHVRFPGDAEPLTLSPFRPWAEIADRRYFSGVASYEVTVRVPAEFVRPETGIRLDFGEARPVPERSRTHGMQAWLEAPVREAAVVWVNGARVGSVWCPPYAVDVTGPLREGTNRIRIDVANLAINAMAGRALPSYRLLHARYGVRFDPQDMDAVEPVASGLLGEMRLVPFAR